MEKTVSKFNFSNAILRGLYWIYRPSKGLFSRASWKMKILVLTNIGILVFRDLRDQTPFYFPILNATLNEVANMESLAPFPK